MRNFRIASLSLALFTALTITHPTDVNAATASTPLSVSQTKSVLTPGLDNQKVFRHHRVAVGNVRLHFVRGGEGKPLFLLHGWPTTWWEWHKVMPGLAEDFDVIAVDTRGLGDSSRPKTGYEKDELANDIVRLAAHLGFEEFSVAGHDLGGQIAFALARTHPEKVERLAILDVPLMGLPYSELVNPWHFAFNKVHDLPEALTQGRERLFLDQFWSGFTYNPRGFEEADVQEFLRSYSTAGAMRAGFEYYRAFERDGAANRAWFESGAKLNMPVLWLGGETTNEADAARAGIISTGDLLGRQLEQATTDLRGESLDGCGHWLASECPEQTEERLRAFFSAE